MFEEDNGRNFVPENESTRVRLVSENESTRVRLVSENESTRVRPSLKQKSIQYNRYSIAGNVRKCACR